MDMLKQIRGRAPSTIANLGCLFDVGAIAIDAYWDEVEIKIKEGSGETSLSIISKNRMVEPYVEKLQKNNVVLETLKVFVNSCLDGKINWDIEVYLYKDVPVGKGLGSSAASIAATLYSLWKLFQGKCGVNEIFYLGGVMEGWISGEPHYDNISAAMFGGVTLLGDLSRRPPEVLRLEWPEDLVFVLGIPLDGNIAVEKTKYMRSILPEKINLRESVKYYSYIPLFIKGVLEKNYFVIGKAINNGGVVEETRAKLMKGYWETKETLLQRGAFAVNISGAGPGIFAISTRENSSFIMDIMEKKLTEYYSNVSVIVASSTPTGALSLTK